MELDFWSVILTNAIFFKELEQIEESWRKETKDLNVQMTKLQEDNCRLHRQADRVKYETEEKCMLK